MQPRVTGGILFHHTPVYSPDGRVLLVPCGASIKVYAVETGILLQTVAKHAAAVTHISCTADGRYLTCSVSGEIIIFDSDFEVHSTLNVGVPLHQIFAMGEQYCLLVSRVHGSKQEADVRFCRDPPPQSASRLYLLNRGNSEITQLKQFVGRLYAATCGSAVFLGDRRTVSIASFDTTTGTLVVTQSFPAQQPTTCLAADDHAMAVGDSAGKITLYHLGPRQATKQILHWHSDAVSCLSILPTGHLLSGGRESVLVLWRIKDQHRQFLPKIGESLEHVSVSPDCRQFAVSTRMNSVHLIDAGCFRTVKSIHGLSGFGMGRTNIAERILGLSNSSVLLVRGGGGCIQAYDYVKDQSLVVHPVIDLLLTDPAVTNPHCPDIECFTATPDGQWIVTAEGRPGIEPHFGYLKMFNGSVAGGYRTHAIIHNPHLGAVSDMCMERIRGLDKMVVCSVSTADTFKLYSFQSVYDPVELEHRDAWRVLYADPLNARPTACALNPDGLLLISFNHSVSIFDIKPLLRGESAHPVFLARRTPTPNKKHRPIKRLSFIPNSTSFVAATEHELYLCDEDAVRHWPVANHFHAVSSDRISLVAQNHSEHWLLEFDFQFRVIGRKRLNAVGRSLLSLPGTTVCIEGDGTILTFSNAEQKAAGVEEVATKRARLNVLDADLRKNTSAPKPSSAKSSKSNAHLYPLCSTQSLPPIREIFRAFIVPRI